LNRPFSRSSSSSGSFTRINGKIRAREVRVIGSDGRQVGVLPLGEAITMARSQGVDLVEVAPTATPPVCRLVDYGKYRYELAKREKEAKKHQHANRVKEIQLTATIDPHDFGVKLGHAIDFLCDDMKVKATLRFRGREMVRKQFGFQVVERFVKELAPYGHPDAEPKLIGRGLNVMLSPLPRNKRAPNPRQAGNGTPASDPSAKDEPAEPRPVLASLDTGPRPASERPAAASGFANHPFAGLDDQLGRS
jgi:translation initiation factor IF-3